MIEALLSGDVTCAHRNGVPGINPPGLEHPGHLFCSGNLGQVCQAISPQNTSPLATQMHSDDLVVCQRLFKAVNLLIEGDEGAFRINQRGNVLQFCAAFSRVGQGKNERSRRVFDEYLRSFPRCKPDIEFDIRLFRDQFHDLNGDAPFLGIDRQGGEKPSVGDDLVLASGPCGEGSV